MIKALLFDLDGTLTHTDPIHLRAIRRLLEEEGLTIDDAGFAEHVSGHSNAQIGLRLFPERTVEAHVALFRRKEALFRAFAVDLVPLAGAIDLIEGARRRGLRLALVTNAPRENVGHMLGAIGLDDAFDAIVYADETARPKPDPLPYLTGLARLGVDASQALAFEDSAPGIRAAKGAGLRTFGVSTTRSETELIEAGADGVIADFFDARILAAMSGVSA